jgi:hypothetical protein
MTKVLLVEDNEMNRDMLSRRLIRRGFEVIFAVDFSQKDSIAAALPRGLSDLLGGTGLLDSLGGAARVAANAGGQAGRVATSAASAVTNAGQRVSETTSGSFNWLYWLLPAAAVAALLIYLFTKPAEQVVQQGVTTAQSLTVNGLVGKQLPDNIASLRAAHHYRAGSVAKIPRRH